MHSQFFARGEAVEAESEEAAQRDAVEVDQGVGGVEPGRVAEPKNWRGDDQSQEREREEAAEFSLLGIIAHDRRPDEVVLLFDGEGPGGAEGAGQGEWRRFWTKSA